MAAPADDLHAGHPYERALLEGEAEVLRDDVAQLRQREQVLREELTDLWRRRFASLTRLCRIETRLAALRGSR